MSTLAAIEVASGMVFGVSESRRPLPTAVAPAAAFRVAVQHALLRGPCFVSFSGGRDSSAVLAMAAQVAREQGLPAPLPVTVRPTDAPAAEESEWQERVIAHLGLSDWIRIDVQDELDAVGPYAQGVMARHGLLWPFNAHFHVPLLERARGGTLLTGVGGDELWAASRSRRVRRRRHVLRLAPRSVRRAVLARRQPFEFPWLSPDGRRAVRRAAASEPASEPWAGARRLAWWRSLRYLEVATGSLDRLAADAGAAICHPLLEPAVWGAVAAAVPRGGFPDARAALAALAGHVLPSEVIERRGKARFDDVFFRDHSREFARAWDGRGVPEDVVDVAALRAHWAQAAPDPHSFTLLQAAWLASAGDRVEQPVPLRVD